MLCKTHIAICRYIQLYCNVGVFYANTGSNRTQTNSNTKNINIGTNGTTQLLPNNMVAVCAPLHHSLGPTQRASVLRRVMYVLTKAKHRKRYLVITLYSYYMPLKHCYITKRESNQNADWNCKSSAVSYRAQNLHHFIRTAD